MNVDGCSTRWSLVLVPATRGGGQYLVIRRPLTRTNLAEWSYSRCLRYIQSGDLGRIPVYCVDIWAVEKLWFILKYFSGREL